MTDSKAEYIRAWEPEDCDTPGYRFELTRRELVGLGAGLVFTLLRPAAAEGQTASAVARIHRADDGSVTLLTGKVDMGQGSRTILTQVVAEEMAVPVARVRVVMGDTSLTPDDGGTWGSLTTPQTVPLVRKAAAAFRQALGPVPPAEWKVCGTSVKPIRGREMVTGALKYATDQKLPGMLHAAVARAPGYKGVRTDRDSDISGVVAKSAEEARRKADGLGLKWAVEPLPTREEAFARYRSKAIAPKPGEGGRYPALVTQGDIWDGFEQSARRFEATYTLANIAHVPLEPRAAIAQWNQRKLTVWSGTQAPFLVRKELATAFRIPEADIRVVAVDVGGAYGGKQRGECETEAARLAQQAPDGVPVKLAWSREEEFTASYCRPAGVIDMKSGLDGNNRLHVWHHVNYNSGAAGLAPAYAIPHVSCEFHRSESPLRQGSYRSLAGVANTFAREMHIDDIARALKEDPLEFRLRNIEDERLKAVLTRGAERFGWKNQPGTGVACNLEKDGRFALFTRMEGQRVVRMILVMDVGAILNPDMLRNQAEGALIQGIGGALWEELTFDSRNITRRRLSQYRVPKFADTPAELEVVLIDRREIASAGSGEAPITVVAPAIGAALRPGHPARSLPFLPAPPAKKTGSEAIPRA